MGISIELQRKNITEIFIERLEQLKQIGIDTSQMTSRDTIETLAIKSGISIENIEEVGLNSNEKIGYKKADVIKAYKGQKGKTVPTKEQVQKLKDLGIDLEVKKITGKEIAESSISSLKDIEMADEEDQVLKELAEKTKEGGVVISE